MGERDGIPHSGHVVGPVPIDALTFPNRCIRCGRPSTVDVKLSLCYSKSDLLGAVTAFMPIPFPAPREEYADVFIPCCRWCREWRALLRFLGLLGTMVGVVGVIGVLLGVYLGYEIEVSGWFIAVYVLLVLGVMIAMMWFALARLPRIVDRRVLRVTFDMYYRSSNTVVLTFTDLAFAEEVAEATMQAYLARRRWEGPPVT